MNLTVVQLFRNSATDIPVTAAATLKEAERLRALGHTTQVIFADNGSEDDSPSLLWKQLRADPNSALLLNDTDVGRCVAWNQALAIGQGDYLLLLDGDVAPLSGTEQLVSYLAGRADCSCIGFDPRNCEPDPALANRSLPPDCEMRVIDGRSDGGLGIGQLALTHYGVFPAWPFRRAGVRFDESPVFRGESVGWESRDLFQQLARLGNAAVHCIINARYHRSRPHPALAAGPPSYDTRKQQAYYELKWLNRLAAGE